jgi:hypothetical protein
MLTSMVPAREYLQENPDWLLPLSASRQSGLRCSGFSRLAEVERELRTDKLVTIFAAVGGYTVVE